MREDVREEEQVVCVFLEYCPDCRAVSIKGYLWPLATDDLFL